MLPKTDLPQHSSRELWPFVPLPKAKEFSIRIESQEPSMTYKMLASLQNLSHKFEVTRLTHIHFSLLLKELSAWFSTPKHLCYTPYPPPYMCGADLELCILKIFVCKLCFLCELPLHAIPVIGCLPVVDFGFLCLNCEVVHLMFALVRMTYEWLVVSLSCSKWWLCSNFSWLNLVGHSQRSKQWHQFFSWFFLACLEDFWVELHLTDKEPPNNVWSFYTSLTKIFFYDTMADFI